MAPHDEKGWVRWTAAGLARLSRVWGCSGSVVIPSAAVANPAVKRCLARFNPDHVLAYLPSWATADEVRPGSIHEVMAGRAADGEAALKQFEEMLRKEPWNALIVQEAEAAADKLRELCGTNRRGDHVQSSHLFDADDVHDLTPLAAVTKVAAIGVPKSLVTTVEALAYAMHVGIGESEVEGQITARQWQEAATRGNESPLLSQLHPSAPKDCRPARSHEASLCVAISRAFQRREHVVVLGDQPEDFALAEVLRQIRGVVTWTPWAEPGLNDMWMFSPRKRLLVTSASLTIDETRQRIEERWQKRSVRSIQPEEERPFDVVHPDAIDINDPLMVVLKDSWDQPRSLPITRGPDGTLQASLSLAAEVPNGLDPDRHRWQVTLTAPSHPVPQLPALGSHAVIATGQNPWETFVRAADGGVTYWSHRFDFVPSGASLAGSLASPRLAWPGIKRILQATASAQGAVIRPSPAGKRAAIAETLIGSRADVEELAASPGWALLRMFMSAVAPGDCPVGSWWKLKSATVLSWEAIAALDDGGWEQTARREQVDQWTSQGVLRRGLILSCGHCPIVEFYPLSEISQSYLCRRCGGTNQLTSDRWRPTAAEPRWFYDLHPAVLELVRNDGDVPLLATRFLRSQHWARQALVCEEFEVLVGGNPCVEMDFALATEQELWLGEAKKNDSLGKSHRERKGEAYKLLQGCTLTGAAGLVLATAQKQWAEKTVEAVKSEILGRRKVRKHVPKVSLLTGLGTSPKLAPLAL
ncbi:MULTISPECIES: hypothetical protein [Streptomyces]|uniref:hypothetical protein n=1 Tax=Streptomyces TaxID=1883 RepID=UPI001319CBF2|nr:MULTISPECIES: hypothetical protein [Streptomyces]